MKERAVMFGKVALARGAVQLPPGAAIGMAIGPQVAQPEPAAIVTTGVGTKVHGGIHRPGAPVGSGASARVALEVALGDVLLLAHTGHKGACASGPQTVWARWSAGGAT